MTDKAYPSWMIIDDIGIDLAAGQDRTAAAVLMQQKLADDVIRQKVQVMQGYFGSIDWFKIYMTEPPKPKPKPAFMQEPSYKRLVAQYERAKLQRDKRLIKQLGDQIEKIHLKYRMEKLLLREPL